VRYAIRYAGKCRVGTKSLCMRLCPLWIICFIFFTTTVSHTAYFNVLQTWIVPQPRVSGCEATGIQYQGGVRGHNAILVWEYLIDKFSGRWRGRGSDTGWLPRRRDKSFCGSVKEKISQLRQTVVRRPENGCERLFQWFPTMHVQDVQNSMEKYWNLCGECWRTYRSLAGVETL